MAESQSGEIKLPSKEEIAKLPRLARIAFAARCARRVQPLFKHFWPDAPQEHLNAVDAAVELAETVGAGASTPGRAGRAAKRTANATAVRAHDAGNAARDARNRADTWHASGIAYSAHAAANAAAGNSATYATASAVTYATNAAGFADHVAATMVAMRRDYELLKAVATREKWTYKTTAPPEFFGPLWPDGVPEGWPKEDADQEIGPHALKIQFSVPRGMNEQQSREFNEKVVAFFTALSELDARMGGTGLQILEDESQDPIDIEEEEPEPTYTGADCAGVGA